LDIPDYVQSVSDSYQQGDIDLSDVLSTGDIFDQFSSSPEQQRLASNLLSVGLPVPENTGVEALISHPDLQSDEVWGHLYPRFSVEDPAPIQPGTTLPSSDYSMAYFGSYNSDGELNTQILSGDSDLQVLDVTGLDDTSDVSVESRDGSAGENSGVVIYRGEDPPAPIQYPADHSDWTIVITGATNQSTHSPSEVTKDGNEYSIPSTDLAAGEGVEEVRLVPPSNYTDPVEPVTNATDTDAEELTSALESVKETIDEIEQSGSNAGGAALGSLPSLPDWIPGKGPVRWVVVGGGALLGIKLIDASSG
jgi:hypothetical protein